ncbi:MAG TPA: zinc ribbon domain-containing protein [Micropepsaceae bacterium]
MNHRWDVDDTTIIELKIGGFAKSILTVNGNAVPSSLTIRRKSEFPFVIPDGRHAAISIRPQFAGVPRVELRVEGNLMVPTEKTPVKCPSCDAVVKPNDRFCSVCGKAMPPAENYIFQKSAKEATTAIWTLAVLFAISGVIMFFVTKSQDAAALARLNSLNPNDPFPNSINGVAYTVAALRDKILWEPWGVLIVNLILAVVMMGLAIWGKRAPLAAALVATATYIVVIVTNAVIAPASIGQGLYLKIIVIIFLVRGIKGALALRSAHA